MSDVRIGNVRKMSSGNTGAPLPAPPAAEEPSGFKRWAESQYGLPGYINAYTSGANQFLSDVGGGIGRFFSGAAPEVPTPTGAQTRGGSPARQPVQQQAPISFEEYLASQGVGRGGGGSAGPNFGAYRAALTEQAQGLNSQIQAMYNALAQEAGANVGRIQDIYGGAQEGIGGVYDSASGNVQQAFGSAQQQAADQLARLGIEEAAPTVINPMALAQAQAVSGLEQGRASGQAASERFGSAASGFGSQMAQVAQQQGTEMNAAILAALQNRLAESLAAEQTGGGGGGGGGMSVRDQQALRESYNRDVLGELPLEERKFAFDVAQAAARPANQYNEWARDKFFELTTPGQPGGKPLFTPEEAQAYLNAVDSTLNR